MGTRPNKWRNKILLGLGFFSLALAIYGFTNRDLFPYYLGYGDPATLGPYSVQMRAGWYPYATNPELQTISYVKGRVFSLLDHGHINFQFFKDLHPDFLRKIKNNSTFHKKYNWGTVFVLK